MHKALFILCKNKKVKNIDVQISMFFLCFFVNNQYMKKVIAICLLVMAVCMTIVVCYNQTQNITADADYLRIHIRANSNSTVDQTVKYQIRDAIVEFLTPNIADCKTKQDVVLVIQNQADNLKHIADDLLKQNGFDYVANIKINNEYFPTRSYQDYTLESGFYDAVIVELGSATGNNWWCVLYPPLCFVNYSAQTAQEVVYKSRFLEIIKSFFNK